MSIRSGYHAAALVAGTLVAGMAWAQSAAKPAMTSTAFDWSQVEATSTKSGAKRQFFDGATSTLERLECHASTINAGQATHEPRQQSEDEVLIVKEGTVEAMIGGQWQRVGPGSVIFEAGGDLHGLRNAGDTPATYYVIKIVPPKRAE